MDSRALSGPLSSEGRFGQEGNAQMLFVRGVEAKVVEKEHFRGVMSSMSSQGVVGGGGGGIDEHEYDEDGDDDEDESSSL